jgi:hypothetical protein
MTKLFVACAAVFLVIGCATTTSQRCQPGEQPAVMDSLYFGTAMPDGEVTPDDWQGFLSDVITPRFPQGLTSWAAAGQWQNGVGELEKEGSHVLHIVHADTPQADRAVREVVAVYKSRFRQEAVLRVRSQACMSL